MRFITTFAKLGAYWTKFRDKQPQTTDENPIGYSSLSPTKAADSSRHYSSVLLWALKNRRSLNIKNIALTGPYGSGKSSILQTFQTNHTNSDLHFLNVSLATFKEEVEVKGEVGAKGTDLLRLIELSILQQIFYQEDVRRVPDSRFKRIKSYSPRRIFWLAVATSIFLVSLTYLLFPEVLTKLLRVKFVSELEPLGHLAALAISIAGIFLSIYKSIRTLTKVRLSKLTIQDTEFEIGDDISKSILNSHIDEIMYFFEVTKYNVVIIEDLDRFQETEIFTKLREINLLLNSSRKITRGIVFLYAVRDDMFRDGDRTKFFDFILPVIPVVNFSNSKEILLQKVKSGEYAISESILEDVSLFVDDMRLLHNIFNEYLVYRNNLSRDLDQNKLFAMVCYKNIFPNDFVRLGNSDGGLFAALSMKKSYVDAEVNRIDAQISEHRKEIKALELNRLQSVEELRKVYLFTYVTQLPAFLSFVLQGRNVSLAEAVLDENFSEIRSGNVQYMAFTNNQYSPQQQRGVPVVFKSIEESIDAEFSLEDRIGTVNKSISSGLELLKRSIAALEQDRKEVRHSRLQDLVAQGIGKSAVAEGRQKQLIQLFLQEGYISEDYLDYISFFYEGSLTKSDYQFLINVKTRTSTPFDHRLHRLENLLGKIDPSEFRRPYILNNNLLDFLLEGAGHPELANLVFRCLSDETEHSNRFIDGYLMDGEYPDKLVAGLCKQWPNFWYYIDVVSSYTADRKLDYFFAIINNSDLASLAVIAKDSGLAGYFSQITDTSRLILPPSAFGEILRELGIAFVDISQATHSDDYFRVISEQGYYRLNPQNLRKVISTYGQFDARAFDIDNYEAVRSSSFKALTSHIEANIESYVTDVFLMVPGGQESEPGVVALLNNSRVSPESKRSIVGRLSSPISKIAPVRFLDICELLLDAGKVVAIWENVRNHFERNKKTFSPTLVKFLSKVENYTELSKVPIEGDDEEITEFSRALVLADSLDISCYRRLLVAVTMQFDDLDLTEMDATRINVLIDQGIVPLSADYYETIASNFETLLAPYVKIAFHDFLGEIESYGVDGVDLARLLTSSSLTVLEKSQLVARVKSQLATGNDDAMRAVGTVLLSDAEFKVPALLLADLLRKPILSVSERALMLATRIRELSRDQRFSVLAQLPAPYSEISPTGKRPVLKKTALNLVLVKALQSGGIISSYTIRDDEIRVVNFRK